MTTLSGFLSRAPHRVRTSRPRGFERALALLDMILLVLAESRRLQRDAHKRYPFFAEW